VRDVYTVDDDRLLLVATDRVSAFDVVMGEPIPRKGAVLTQLTAWWLRRFEGVVPHHMLASDTEAIIAAVPALAGYASVLSQRAMLVRATTPFPVECVIRGYLAGSAWKEYRETGTLAGEPMPAGLRESDRLDPPLFSPARKAETGHDENITPGRVTEMVGRDTAATLERLTRSIYEQGAAVAAARGIIVADTKFEFGSRDGRVVLIDEVLTPDSSRFWPADTYVPGRAQPSFDKQPLRDYLERTGQAGVSPPPPLPDDIVRATRERYLDAYRRITGSALT
jgi:phosphoribosylaminoimidazole-succinocarboxamide synthase